MVVVGEHGQSLGDHGEESHGLFVFDVALRCRSSCVTRILRVGFPLMRVIDVMPTILELFDLPTAGVDGVSLVPRRRQRTDPRLDVYAESTYPERFGWARLRSLRDERYKVIQAPRSDLVKMIWSRIRTSKRTCFTSTCGRGSHARPFARLRRMAGRPAEARPQVDSEVAARVSALGYVTGTAEQASRKQRPDRSEGSGCGVQSLDDCALGQGHCLLC